MDMTTCPVCGGPAEVQWRAVLDSTDGPVEHVKIACAARHRFLLPTSDLVRGRRGPARPAASAPARSHPGAC